MFILHFFSYNYTYKIIYRLVKNTKIILKIQEKINLEKFMALIFIVLIKLNY